ncbi:MAG: HaeIII family restriction endonuclease [Candidatus Fimenecus sp.]
MSNASNNQGRAYEYICLLTLKEEISKYRQVEIEENSSYQVAKNAWNSLETAFQDTLKQSAKAAVITIFDMEPLILEDGSDQLDLKIQKDSEGESGDVRDILIIRRNIKWEIGLSIKHNHFAVKHSRLSPTIDFGQKWFGVECSEEYWNAVNPVFDFLKQQKQNGLQWSELSDKENVVYIPLLKAFVNEIAKSNKSHTDIPKKMVEYLLGEFDFYKVISIDNKKLTQIQTYNLRGTLNKPSKKCKAKISIPVSCLPTRIISLDLKPNSTNTVELYMDNGWQFSFRIHNASTKVETSLKFDVQIIGMPTTIISINCLWNE